MNIALRVAVVESGRKQFEIADLANIEETRFSKIVNGRLDPTPDEQAALCRVLRRKRHDLFPSEPAARREAVS